VVIWNWDLEFVWSLEFVILDMEGVVDGLPLLSWMYPEYKGEEF
jgi:hypothetical protein